MELLNQKVNPNSIIHVKNSFYDELGLADCFEDKKETWFTLESQFGQYLAGFVGGVLCYLAFYDTKEELKNIQSKINDKALLFISSYANPKEFEIPLDIQLALKCTDFELKVYKELLKIKKGETISYQALASRIEQPLAVRAVANAVAKNPIAYLIPCHRVIPKDGLLGNYRWGPQRKSAMLAYEKMNIN